MSTRSDQRDAHDRPRLPLTPPGRHGEAEDEEADDDAPPPVDRLDPGLAVADLRDDRPWQSGQSGQPMPEPVLRTMTPMTIITKVATTVERASFWKPVSRTFMGWRDRTKGRGAIAVGPCREALRRAAAGRRRRRVRHPCGRTRAQPRHQPARRLPRSRRRGRAVPTSSCDVPDALALAPRRELAAEPSRAAPGRPAPRWRGRPREAPAARKSSTSSSAADAADADDGDAHDLGDLVDDPQRQRAGWPVRRATDGRVPSAGAIGGRRRSPARAAGAMALMASAPAAATARAISRASGTSGGELDDERAAPWLPVRPPWPARSVSTSSPMGRPRPTARPGAARSSSRPATLGSDRRGGAPARRCPRPIVGADVDDDGHLRGSPSEGRVGAATASSAGVRVADRAQQRRPRAAPCAAAGRPAGRCA